MAQITRIDPQAKQRKEKLRVAAYCRVSSNSADQLNSYTRQLNTYKAMIAKRTDWVLVEIFADEGITGTSAEKRPEFRRMISLCELKQIDLIVTKSVSRFARNVKEALEYVRKLKLLGVGVMFEKEGINTCSMADEMLLNTFAAIAQEESTSISQNLKLANRKRMAAGEYKHASTAYGFKRIDGKLVPYEPEANVVKRIYKDFLNGISTTKIAETLANEKIPTKQGTLSWKNYLIADIIRNERNVGDTMSQKYINIGFPFKQIKNRGEEDRYYTMNTHEGIVDRETFEAANELLQSKSAKYAAKTERKEYVFSKVFHCSACGAPIIRKQSKGRERWCCQTHVSDRNYTLDLDLTEYIESIKPDTNVYQKIRRDKLYGLTSDGTPFTISSIYSSLVFQTEHENKHYILCAGTWYQVDNSFFDQVNNYVSNQVKISDFSLPDCDKSDDEGEYNEKVANGNPDFCLMDKQLTSVLGGPKKIEACDIFTKNKQFIHVKNKGKSAQLSHLFAQGKVSAECFISDESFRKQVSELATKGLGTEVFNYRNKPSSNEFEIVYAIIDDKDNDLNEMLPFFSKVNLMLTSQELDRMHFRCSVCLVKKV